VSKEEVRSSENKSTGQTSQSSISVHAERGGAEIVDRLANEWRELCNEGPSDQPFCRPEWIGAYARAFGASKTLLLLTARIGDLLKAILPLEEERSLFCGMPIRKLRGTANAHSGRFDLVRTDGLEADAAILNLWSFLKQLPGWDMLELPYVAQGAALDQLVRAAQSDGFPVGKLESLRSPYINLAEWGTSEDLWPAGVSSRFRKDLRRVMRKLTSEGPVHLHRIEKADGEALKQFYDLEGSGWKGREDSAIASNEDTRQFYNEIARNAERFGYLSIYFLEFDGRMIAGHLGLTYRGRYFSPKVAYDENYRLYAPGQLLMNAVLRDCARRGLSELDILGPWAEWKAKWTPLVHPHAHWYVFSKRTYGRTLHSLRFRIRPAIKSIISPKRTEDLKSGSPVEDRKKSAKRPTRDSFIKAAR
jgi:CelD/BcsL family acetyltransferase involved in cellulose biosynthesis